MASPRSPPHSPAPAGRAGVAGLPPAPRTPVAAGAWPLSPTAAAPPAARAARRALPTQLFPPAAAAATPPPKHGAATAAEADAGVAPECPAGDALPVSPAAALPVGDLVLAAIKTYRAVEQERAVITLAASMGGGAPAPPLPPVLSLPQALAADPAALAALAGFVARTAAGLAAGAYVEATCVLRLCDAANMIAAWTEPPALPELPPPTAARALLRGSELWPALAALAAMDAGAPPHPDALVWRLPGCAAAFREAVDAAARATAREPRRRRTTSSSGAR